MSISFRVVSCVDSENENANIKSYGKNIMNKLKNEMNIEDENTCSFYKKFAEYNKDQKLSKLVNKRALEQLKYHCDLTKE